MSPDNVYLMSDFSLSLRVDGSNWPKKLCFQTVNHENFRVTKDDNEMKALIESGFQYVCENDGLKFFRKPK